MTTATSLETTLQSLSHIVWGWPIVSFIVVAGIIFSFAFRWLQISMFFTAWKLLFANEKNSQEESTISPLQAFINALSASLGNGGLAGMAIVLVDGGPGTAFWVFILGFFSMILRFGEVYASTKFQPKNENECGPLVYIKKIPFIGRSLTYIYALCMLIFIFVAGSSMQCNSMGLSLGYITGWSPYILASLFTFIVLYITLGGAKRIMKASEVIIPIKVCLFFAGITAVLVYNASAIPDTLRLIMANALQWPSLAGGIAIYGLQHAIGIGLPLALNATEAGLGTAGIFFGSTKTKQPFKTAVMSIITAFISTNLVCTLLIVALITSGVWQNGLTSTPLVIAAFSTVFGSFAGPLITFLSFSFGLGVLVAYSFLGTKIWTFLFGKKSLFIFITLFAAAAFLGTLGTVKLVWTAIELFVAALIVINIGALLWILPELRTAFKKDYSDFEKTNRIK